MCFNEKISMNVFIFGILCSLYLINRGIKKNNGNDKLYGILLILISFMQLIEYFLWKNQKSCNKINQIKNITQEKKTKPQLESKIKIEGKNEINSFKLKKPIFSSPHSLDFFFIKR